MLGAAFTGARAAMSRAQRFYIGIDDFGRARGDDPGLAFQGASPEALAVALEAALRTPQLFERWRQRQPDPDAVDPALGAVDMHADARAEQADLHVELEVVTTLPMRVLRQRLQWLIGPHWSLRDVRRA